MTSQAITAGDAYSLLPTATENFQPTAASLQDYELARRIAGGDMSAFEEFYQCYYRRVYSLCFRMTGDATEAEDLTQETFIHVYHKINSFRGNSTMRTWLHRVTVNKVLMHFRTNSARRERLTDDGELPEPPAPMIDHQSHAPVLDRLALERAIAQLAPGYRVVLILHDIEGYEHSEIGQMCGISVGTSKSQLHKARRKLHTLLQRQRIGINTPRQAESNR